jgi:hypothetical protein
MKKTFPLFLLLSSIILTSFHLSAFSQNKQQLSTLQFQAMADSIYSILRPSATVYGKILVDTVYIYPNKKMDIHFSSTLSDFPIRDTQVSTIYDIVRGTMPDGFEKYSVSIFSNRTPIEDLSSSYYSGRKTIKSSKKNKDASEEKWVENISSPYSISSGLQNSHIALWQSHGFYYEQKLQRWEWQRARIFQTVEDLYTQSYVLPFLVPMLENAGACIALPRERDSQINEVIVDNDQASQTRAHGTYSENYITEKYQWTESKIAGFADKKEYYEYGENPFMMGSARMIEQSSEETASASWVPDIPQSGEYAVYVSYQTLSESTDKALYSVFHNGGKTDFVVNQKIGGGTFTYLGTFSFTSSDRLDEGRFQGVILSNGIPEGEKLMRGAIITADAVKIGGGMGNIARKPAEPSFDMVSEISGYPRFTEGSRYWLQWSGFADSIYSPNNNMNDYNDDYMSRGRWVNALSGGSKANPKEKGYNIPIDLSMAFHTDAGTTLTDSIIGTLAIYTRFSEGKDFFPTGDKRIVSRELADIIQTQIVDDIRAQYENKWIRRALWDRSYSESRTPKVPSMLLELLSHQNFADMRYGLDPNFRFTVSRAIYKGILRFQSERYDFEYVVQPLAVNSFSATLSSSSKKEPQALLSWKPTFDPLEPTAIPSKYIVYTRITDPSASDEGGFDNGFIVENGTSVTIPIEAGKIYSYKVAALNEGGISFPSEILSIGLSEKWKESYTVLIMNGFDRVSAPASYSSRDSLRAGFENYLDGGVPYIKDFSFIGNMHEYRRAIPWMDDDAPGFGASYATYEDKVIAGNTFDYPFIHGLSILKAGYNFVSCSRDAITHYSVSLNDYPIVDMIMGKQIKTQIGRDGASIPKYEVFPILLQKAIEDYCSKGGNILISGSYVATDLWDKIYNSKPIKSQNDKIKELILSSRKMALDLNSLIENVAEHSSMVNKLNDSLGFDYFCYDSSSVQKIEQNIKNGSSYIDSLASILNKTTSSISDFEKGTSTEERSRQFAMNTLKYRWMTHYASSDGKVKPVQNPLGIGYVPTQNGYFSFNTKPNTQSYCVESPDGLTPVGENAWTIFRYSENNISAGVAYKGKDYRCVTLGFPIETLSDSQQIDTLMSDLLQFFTKEN